MKKTKIIATIGPSTNEENEIKNLILNGVDAIRLNMSHATTNDLKELKVKLDKINEELNTNIPILVDLNGPNVRLHKIEENSVLEENTKIRIYKEEILGNRTKFSSDYENLIDDLQINSIIKLGDGLIELMVIDKTDNYVIAEVIHGGEIKKGMSLNAPGTYLKLPFLNDKDKEIIKVCSEIEIDYLALSFVSCMEDVLEVQDELINLNDDNISIIAKIENEQGIYELDEIIKHVDGIMVARGDLGIEVPIQKLPQIQKEIIEKCRKSGKISIVATEMMSSMTNSPAPTRAEVTDVATAVLEGADCVMLSGETTIGAYPVETVKMMSKILESSEENIEYENTLEENDNITSLIASNVAKAANSLKAKAIIAPTISGYTAKKISYNKPKSIIIAATPQNRVARELNLYFGIKPVLVKELNSLDRLINQAKNVASKVIDLNEGDYIVVTGGYPFKESKHTNFMKIEEI